MKKTLLLLLTAVTMSCTTITDSQVERLESLIQAQNETLVSIEQDIANLEPMDAALQEEIVAPQPQVIEKVIIEDYKLGDKIVVGEKEKIYLDPPGEYFDARIDTGANTSSIHASEITWFERDGRKWVRFNMNHDGVDRVMEKQVDSIRSIRQTNSTEIIDRPVVRIYSQIGDVELEVEYTLADRSHMTFPVLIGRNFLQDLIIVDVAHEYLQKERNR